MPIFITGESKVKYVLISRAIFENLKFSEFILSERKMGPIILFALTAHHTPNLVSGDSTLFISLGLSAYSVCYFEYLLGRISKPFLFRGII